MNPKTSLLLVVDVQNGFVTPDTEHVVEPIAKLVKQWQKQKGQAVYSRFINLDNSPWERLLNWQKTDYIQFSADIMSHV
jgi:nicotinamidase-related amidase